MAVIDKKGALHGGVSNIVYRTYRGEQIDQIKAAGVKQTRILILCRSLRCRKEMLGLDNVLRIWDNSLL